MKIEDQVCTIEQAEKLKALGVLQLSVWFWERMREPVTEGCAKKRLQVHYNTNSMFSSSVVERVFSAFTVAELGVLLCHRISIDGVKYKFRANLEKNGLWHLKFRTLNNKVCTPLVITQNTNEAIARADMLIKLLEKKFIKAEEANKRLSLIFSQKTNTTK